MDESLDL